MKTAVLIIFCTVLCGCLYSQDSGMAIQSESVIGTTKYDLQVNKSGQNRMYRYPDGTIGATWMLSQTVTPFDDRGTGYNYFNGSSWGPFPTARIENIKSGWQSYSPYGTNGEIVVSHKALLGALNLCKRNTRGGGAWTLVNMPNPSGYPGMLWPRMVTSGPNHMSIHVIANTAPTSNGGTVYQGLNGAILYIRSLDGGNTWGSWQILPGMTSATYAGFPSDAYTWAEPRGDTLCFVVGDNWNDLFIMKSTNNGASWTKTIAWQCNYNKWSGGSTVNWFYCPDGANAVALDKDGVAHVAFGRMKVRGDYNGTKYQQSFTDGLIYWNETQPALIQSLDSATLLSGGHFIGWVQDPAVWTAGSWTLPYYYLSMSSMPAITVDQNNHIFVIWSGLTNNRDPNSFMLRHLYGRASVCNGSEWCNIVELTAGSAYSALECAYPSLAPTSDNNLYFIYQSDNMGGNYVKGLSGAQGQTVATTNEFRCQTLSKTGLLCGSSPVVNFSASTVTPLINQTVIFNNLTINCPSAYQWSFNPSSVVYVDGTSAASKNPHVRFTAVGSYTVTLQASNNFGTGSLNMPDYIVVSPPPPPVSDFIGHRTNIWTGDYILFTDQSTGSPTSWLWTFEGGTPATWSGQTPPKIEYFTTGDFDVTLEVSNEWGTSTKTKTDYIHVTHPPKPVADFTGDPTTLNVGSSVQFTDHSINNPSSWSWTFEGGNPSSSAEKTPPPVIYNSEGQFTVSLIVANASGSDTLTREQYITVIIPVVPVADFSGNPTILHAGSQVQFSDLSTGNPESWQWTFEGGDPATSDLQTPPPVTYAATGIFDVTLTVTNVNGNSTKKRTNYITVISPGGPIARFSGNPTNPVIGGQVQFTDESLGPPTAWIWTFEGGEPGTFEGQTPPPITYNMPGSFDVTLKVTNLQGTNTSVMQDYIEVTNPSMPVAVFGSDKTGIAKGDSVLFTDESTGYPTAWSWTFEGGMPEHSAEKSPPMIVYNNPGKFDVTLVVTNENGSNTLVRSDYISVGGIGFEDEPVAKMLVYPNPAEDKLFIDAGRIISWARIVNLFGKCMLTTSFSNNSGRMEISGLPPGVYILQVAVEDQIIQGKILVK